MKALYLKFRSVRAIKFLLLLLISFWFFGFQAEAQQIQEVYSYIDQNGIKASDHFSDLLYGGVGNVGLINGAPVATTEQAKSLYIKMSDISLLEGILQKYKDVEFVQVDVSSSQSGKIDVVNLVANSKVKYILFLSTETISPSSLVNSIEGLSEGSPIVLLYQISRPG